MALIIRIGSYHELTSTDSLGRDWAGWFPRMTEQEAYEAGRGAWKLGPRADQETFAVIVGGKTVRAVVEIESITDPDEDDRRSLIGHVLEPGHPLREAYYDQPDPSTSTSRNPIGYTELPEELEFRMRDCACGCGTQTKRDFAPGHDQKAIHDRIKTHFDGSTLTFIHWMDQHGPAATAATR